VICEDRNNITESGPNNRTQANCGPRFAKPYTKVAAAWKTSSRRLPLQRIPQRYRSSSAAAKFNSIESEHQSEPKGDVWRRSLPDGRAPAQFGLTGDKVR
jgi:hypothetical protein